eukprot:COSAG02_NODE_6253_length_3699_cov_1.362222_4_plen_49_part_00
MVALRAVDGVFFFVLFLVGVVKMIYLPKLGAMSCIAEQKAIYYWVAPH